MKNSKPFNKNKGEAKASPRKHDPRWKDSTATQRQQSRRAKLNAIAQAAGFASWSAFETACLNGAAQPTKRATDGAESARGEAVKIKKGAWQETTLEPRRS